MGKLTERQFKESKKILKKYTPHLYILLKDASYKEYLKQLNNKLSGFRLLESFYFDYKQNRNKK